MRGIGPGPVFPKARLLAVAAETIARHSLSLVVLPGLFAELSGDPADLTAAVVEAGLRPPLLFRSAAEHEDAGGALSGVLHSHLVRHVDEVAPVLAAMGAEVASVLGAGRGGVIVQPHVALAQGAVLGCEVGAGQLGAALLEVGIGRVPVEGGPDLWLELAHLEGAGGPVVLAGANQRDDLVALAEDGLAFVAALVEDLALTDTFVELELAIGTDGRHLVFQCRLDRPWPAGRLARRRPLRNFGADRNYPVPVSHLTGTLVAPVFTAAFGARVTFDPTNRELVTDAPCLPTPELSRRARAAGRRVGPLLDALERREPDHRSWWTSVRAWQDDLATATVPIRLRRSIVEGRAWLQRYFDNELWLACLDPGSVGPPLPAAEAGLVSSLLRSYRATEVAGALRGVVGAPTTVEDVASVALVGDDELLSPALFELLAGEGRATAELAHRHRVGWAEVLDRALGYLPVAPRADAFVRVVQGRGLDPSLEGAALSVWYQEEDNRFKEVVYLAIREASRDLGRHAGVDLDDLALLTTDEAVALAEGRLTGGRVVALVGSRRSRSGRVRPVPDGATPAERRPVVVSGRLGAAPRTLELADGAETDVGGRPGARWFRSISARQVLALPAVDVVIVEELGLLAHAANALRARADVPLVIAGWRPSGPLQGARVFLAEASDGTVSVTQLPAPA